MMDGGDKTGEFKGNVMKSSPVGPISTLNPSLSGRLTPRNSPRNSPRFQRLHSVRTPRSRGGGALAHQYFRSNRIVYWLLLITLWTYGGFYIQSRWAHADKQERFPGGFGHSLDEAAATVHDSEHNSRRTLVLSDDKSVDVIRNESSSTTKKVTASIMDAALATTKTEPRSSHQSTASSKKRRTKRTSRAAARGKSRDTSPPVFPNENPPGGDVELQEEKLLKQNSTYGLLVGPFGSTEDRTLEWSPDKRTGTCDRQELFAKLVWSRNFVLIFHELSMTGAPLSMLELATELLSCGATVNAVVLSRKGGLMSELTRRRIKLVDDKTDHSFKVAMKADLIIAGSAVCAQWIEKYLEKYAAGTNQITWWIMENRREYFERSKGVLNRVKMLLFLSEIQSKQWLAWCEEEKIRLTTPISLIPLSVNDQLSFVAGIPCTLNTPTLSPEKMLEKKRILRNAVRQEMGLNENDMLVMALSSINAAKGQLLLLESARLIINEKNSRTDPIIQSWLKSLPDKSNLVKKRKLSGLLQEVNGKIDPINKGASRRNTLMDKFDSVRKLRSNSKQKLVRGQNLKILIGSVGSKSNKAVYLREMLDFVSENANLNKSLLWTPATTRVASLYSAADVYVINSQGLGETFGRVTIEAMAFGLPVLGTDAGGTKEIVDENVTGLLHPVGRAGRETLGVNIKYLLNNPTARKEMGMRGREKVERMYLKRHMYKMFFEVLFKCMRIK